jgi:hypothetical protein
MIPSDIKKTVVTILTGVNELPVHLVAPFEFLIPNERVENFDHYCGAGRGFGDIVIPDRMWGLNISPACAVHDEMWNIAPATWEAFHASNSIFLRNLIQLITIQSKSSILKRLRLYRAVTYYNAVDSFGKNIFWKLKREQGHT